MKILLLLYELSPKRMAVKIRNFMRGQDDARKASNEFRKLEKERPVYHSPFIK